MTDQPTVVAETAQAIREHVAASERQRRLDLDVRGIIALTAIMGGFALAFANLFLAGSAEIPTWAAAMVMSVIGFFFGSKGGGGNGYGRKTDT